MSAHSYRRRQYLIKRKFQLRYIAMVTAALIMVSAFSICVMYFGIWGAVLDEFSNESIRYQLLEAARQTDYEFARRPFSERRFSTLALFKETDLLSQRQREIFSDILGRTNERLLWKLASLVLLIALWAVFITHRIAGPLYRFDQCFKQLGTGDLTVRARLRKGDQVKDLMVSFNSMVDNLDKAVKRVKDLTPGINPPALKEQIQAEFNNLRCS